MGVTGCAATAWSWMALSCEPSGGERLGGSGVTPAAGVCGRTWREHAAFPGEPLQALFPWELQGIAKSQFTENFLKVFLMPPNPSAGHQGRTEGQGSCPPSHPPAPATAPGGAVVGEGGRG